MIRWISKLVIEHRKKVNYRKRITKFFNEKYTGVYEVLNSSNQPTKYFITFKYCTTTIIEANVLAAYGFYTYQFEEITKQFGEKAKYYGFNEMYFTFLVAVGKINYSYKNGKILLIDNIPD